MLLRFIVALWHLSRCMFVVKGFYCWFCRCIYCLTYPVVMCHSLLLSTEHTIKAYTFITFLQLCVMDNIADRTFIISFTQHLAIYSLEFLWQFLWLLMNILLARAHDPTTMYSSFSYKGKHI